MWVMPPGQEATLQRALEPPGARPWLKLQSAEVANTKVTVRFGKARTGAPALAVTLVHPSTASSAATTLAHVAVEPVPGPVRDRDLAVLVDRLTAAGEALALERTPDARDRDSQKACL